MEYPQFSIQKSYKEESKLPYVVILFILLFCCCMEIGVASGALDGKLNGADAIFRWAGSFFTSIFGTIFSSILFGIGVPAVIGYLVNEIVVNKRAFPLKR